MKHVFRRKQLVALVAAGLLAFTMAACGGGSSDSSPGSKSDAVDTDTTLRVSLPVSASLDPTQIRIASYGMIALWPVYDRLIQVMPDNSYGAMLATDWSFSGDGLTLTMKLREGVTFSDGEPFNAEAAKTSLEYFKNSDSVSSSGPLANIKAIKAVSATELEIDLAEPSTSVLGGLATPTSGAMISPKAIHGGDLATNPVGTGAYVVKNFRPSVSVTYERRSGQNWDEKAGQVAKVVITTFTSDEARTNAIRSGQSDITTYSASDKPALNADITSGKLNLDQSTGFLMYTLFLNTAKAPFNDVKVRQAVNYALDRPNLTGVIDETASTRVQAYPKGLPGFDDSLESTFTFDPGKAKELLAEAGYPDGIDLGQVLVGNSGGFPGLAEAMQGSLKEQGIDVEIKTVDTAQINSEWSKGTYSGMLMYQSPPDLEPVNYFVRNYTNPYWWQGPLPDGFEPLLKGIGDPREADQQDALIGAANKFATENAMFAPILQKKTGYVAAPNVQNFQSASFAQFGGADFRYVSLTK
ncbi:ABC transporter substrate-binding protein [Acrocarpospora pleiomorpha]|uniref:ABC transporter substrate-binding protein n=1 Tax=Acrocarpospora pleiomorpha TaxID=90975 RepID=A0A5M3Y457_9ACTN|nr:ABC transporter substrate-binding protein [Acrocarpospora pleiomorpha]GES25758.1 ABC transporter substrate-binding protein [Acrocarpospora pleiomorpha]